MKNQKRNKAYIIAEIGANHNGDMDLAKSLVELAKQSGADCVKFQSWTKDSVFARVKYEENCFLTDDYRDRTDHTLESIVDAYSMGESQLLEIMHFCKELEIDFSSTPFSKEEADFLVDVLDAPFIKVASMDLNNYPFLEYLAKKQKPMIISTGLSELYEIDKAVRTIEEQGNTDITILHCVSTYPPRDADVNLKNILTLKSMYPTYCVGFSDHTIGVEIPLAAIALGAEVIEKHFTLDKEMEGWDHKVSATPEELVKITQGANRIIAALGRERIMPTESEEKKREFRRSIVLAREVNAGDVITSTDLDFKRPGGGVKPEYLDLIVGRRAKFDLAYDHVLNLDDLV